jgi:hypothetical protein
LQILRHGQDRCANPDQSKSKKSSKMKQGASSSLSLQDKQALIRALFEKTLPLLVFASDEACSKLLYSLQPFVSALVKESQLRQQTFHSMDVDELLSLAATTTLSVKVVATKHKKPVERKSNSHKVKGATKKLEKAREKRVKDEDDDEGVEEEEEEEVVVEKEKKKRKDQVEPVAQPPRKRERSPNVEGARGEAGGDMWDFEKVCKEVFVLF